MIKVIRPFESTVLVVTWLIFAANDNRPKIALYSTLLHVPFSQEIINRNLEWRLLGIFTLWYDIAMGKKLWVRNYMQNNKNESIFIYDFAYLLKVIRLLKFG